MAAGPGGRSAPRRQYARQGAEGWGPSCPCVRLVWPRPAPIDDDGAVSRERRFRGNVLVRSPRSSRVSAAEAQLSVADRSGGGPQNSSPAVQASSATEVRLGAHRSRITLVGEVRNGLQPALPFGRARLPHPPRDSQVGAGFNPSAALAHDRERSFLTEGAAARLDCGPACRYGMPRLIYAGR